MIRRTSAALPPIAVNLLRIRGRRFYVFRWCDPQTGLAVERSSGILAAADLRRKAQRAAAELEATLNINRYEITWEDFCETHQHEHLRHASPSTQATWRVVAGHVTSILRPYYVADLTARALNRLTRRLRSRLKPSTVAVYLRVLQGALRKQ